MNVYAVTMTLEFSVVASSRKQAEKFARESIEERCVTLEDAEMTIAKMQFVAGSPSAHNDGHDVRTCDCAECQRFRYEQAGDGEQYDGNVCE